METYIFLGASAFLLGYCLGQITESKSWEWQANYDTPKHRHGKFYYVMLADVFDKMSIEALWGRIAKATEEYHAETAVDRRPSKEPERPSGV